MNSKSAGFLAVLLLAFPLMSWANNVGFQTSGGQISSNGSVLTVRSSTLVSLNGMNGAGAMSGDLGVVSFSTGALVSGSFSDGGTLAGGGSFSMVGNGSNGLPKGVIFKGQFNGPVKWVASFDPKAGGGAGRWYYSLSGSISGTLSTGQRLSGNIQFRSNDVARGQRFSDAANLSGGVGSVTVPEPGTLGLLASGLFGVAVLVRRRIGM
jgi:hypothetical protein